MMHRQPPCATSLPHRTRRRSLFVFSYYRVAISFWASPPDELSSLHPPSTTPPRSYQQKTQDMSSRRTPPRRKSSRAEKNRRSTLRSRSLGSGEAPEVDDDGHVLKRPSWLVR